jgi:hypothetical protein
MYLLSLLALDKLKGIPPKRKLDLLSSICNQPKKKFEEAFAGLGFLYSFCMRDQVGILNSIDLNNPINSFKEAFEGLLRLDPFVNISDLPDFADLYIEAFDHTRVPLALEIYKAKISDLNDKATNSTLKRFILSILIETAIKNGVPINPDLGKPFSEARFQTDISPHLAQIKEKNEKLFNDWKLLEFSQPVRYAAEQQGQASFSFRNFLETKLRDAHWSMNGNDLLPDLTSYLKRQTPRNPDDPILILCSELISNDSFSKEEQVGKLQEILNALEVPELSGLELNNDLRGLITTLIANEQSASNETVMLSKDWQDLLLSGTEVAGSCQRIDGNPSLNKCLLAYCMDGKNAMLAVKGKEGKILARSMLRLLWNEKEQKPALFLDTLYPDPCPSERKNAIASAAIECAKKLNCDLFTHWYDYPPAPGQTINSLQGPCPYEYADAAGGVIPRGIFEIKDLRKVYSPI